MFRFFSMTSDRAFGMLLFSGVIVLTASKRTGIFSRLNWIKNIIDKDRDGPRGDFIVRNTSKNRKWKDMYSLNDDDEAGLQCELEVKNNTDEVLLLCWITPTGKLCNFAAIHDGSINDNSVSNCHVESAGTYHAFVCFRRSKRSPKVLSEVSDEDFVFLYRPTLADYRHKITLSKSRNDFKCHIRCKKIKDKDADLGVHDSSDKIYLPQKVCGFTCNMEPGVCEQTPGLLDALTIDLEMLRCLLPTKALMQLQVSTPLWINTSLKYGPVGSPVDNSMCFHPSDGQKWLSSMGMRPDKAGGVEMYCAKHYLEFRDYWGTGGVLLHEFCHAYHFKHCKDGFNNEEVKEAYETAMEKKLYDCVPVHGPQGTTGGCKAYACYNCMEFFAELSVAFLWQKDSHVDGAPLTCAKEYNKWFPHNYCQLKSHDLDTCKVLAQAWGLDMAKIPDAPTPLLSSGRPIISLPGAMSAANSMRSPSKLE